MPRHFNTTGPVHPEDHDSIDPMTRLNWEEVHDFIDAKKFFALRAPRQTDHPTRNGRRAEPIG